MDAKPANGENVPILIGGSSEFAARRAGRLGDGWYPYVISPEAFAEGVETIERTATGAGRDPKDVELTIWPASFDFTRTMDVPFVRSYVDAGASRVMISQGEAQALDIEGQRAFVRRYQDEVLSKL